MLIEGLESINRDIPFKESDYRRIKKIVYENIGINLTEQKKALIVGRLRKVLRKGGFNSYRDYLDYVENDKSGKAIADLADVISTNHTYFFREQKHFDFLNNKILPSWKNKRDLRIWSAACSSGEEPYSIIMALMDYYKESYKNLDAGVLATDISIEVLEKAQKALYNSEAVNKMSKQKILNYFNKERENFYKVKDKVKKEVLFKKFNLLNKTYPFKRKFDLIFCRNVMIYFDQKTKIELNKKLYNSLNIGGYLFIGHSETLERNSTPFKYVEPAIYKKEY